MSAEHPPQINESSEETQNQESVVSVPEPEVSRIIDETHIGEDVTEKIQNIQENLKSTPIKKAEKKEGEEKKHKEKDHSHEHGPQGITFKGVGISLLMIFLYGFKIAWEKASGSKGGGGGSPKKSSGGHGGGGGHH